LTLSIEISYTPVIETAISLSSELLKNLI